MTDAQITKYEKDVVIKLIAGLANPGYEYADTRHNAGSWYLQLLARHHKQVFKKEKKFYGYTCQLTLGGKNIHLLLPTSFMNASGKAIAAMAIFYQIIPEDILVAHDELDLLPGRIRLKLGCNHGGHNGLKDIIICLGNHPRFHRLRIGIGHPGDKKKVASFVLNKPPKEELQLINSAINEAVCCTEILITQGAEKAMNRLHAYRAW